MLSASPSSSAPHHHSIAFIVSQSPIPVFLETMLGIPELDNVICRLLSPHDLAKCAQVNKQWSIIVLPYLWSDLSCLENYSDSQRQAFFGLVLDEYNQERHGHGLKDQARGEESTVVPASCHESTTLAKYGPWIRTLPDPNVFQLEYNPTMASQASTMDKPLTVLDVFAHLLRHCHAAQFSHFCLDYGDHGLGISNDANVELVLARARHVTVQASHRGKYQEFWTLKRHLKHCSTSLGKLSLEITFKYIPGLDTYIGYDENFDEEEEEQEENDKVEPRGWKSLKELHLRLQGCIGSPPPSKFWSWLYKQCGQVETLEVSKFRRGADTGIAQAMLTYMPNLIELTVGSTSGRDTSPIKQDRVAKLLSGSSKGWKSVMLTGAVMSGPISMNALSKHFSTLEVLHLDHLSTCLSGRDLVQVLALCPNLRVVCCDSDLHEVHCDAFINQDPKTGELVTWACESTLKKLRIRICGFPGYDPRSPYDGGSTLQMLVYERLARLSNLETLSLGKAALTGALGSWLRIQRHQSNCLKMSLKSGLDMLSGLRSLKVLEVDGMETEAGIREVRWMTTHWPKLSALYGLDSRGNKEAIEWLKEHCPRIDLQAQSKSP